MSQFDQSTFKRTIVSGLGLRGTRKDDSYLCHLEFFPREERWFLNKLIDLESDEHLLHELKTTSPLHMAVDIPLNLPPCSTCFLKCPGIELCPVNEVVHIRQEMKNLLESDAQLYQSAPKRYEEMRVEVEQYDHNRPLLAKEQTVPALSRSFKKRLRKGFIPYWNRPVDFWIWAHYYDVLLELFNYSYDSFGPNPPNALFRFHYLRRHLPKSIVLWETAQQLLLVEMLRVKLSSKEELKVVAEVEQGALAKMNLIKSLEKSLQIFIYDHDLEILVHSPRAFEAFLLAVSAQCAYRGKMRKMEAWANTKDVNFLVPLI